MRPWIIAAGLAALGVVVRRVLARRERKKIEVDAVSEHWIAEYLADTSNTPDDR